MKKQVNKELVGTLLVITTALFSGFNIVANKYFLIKVDPLVLTATRGLLIGILFLIITLFIKQKSNPATKKTNWKNLLLIGILGGGIAFWAFFTGLQYTLASRAAFIHKTLPVYAIILGYFFLKERITKKQLIASLIMITGLFIMELHNLSWQLRIGDLLVLLATILWAIENTIAKKSMLEQENNFMITFARMFFGSILLLALIIITGKMSLLQHLNVQQWNYILISGGLLAMYVLTYYWGLKYISLSKATTILLLSPVISLIFAITWLGEVPTTLQLLGSSIILLGSWYLLLNKKK